MKEVFSELEGGCEGSNVLSACVRACKGFLWESLLFFGCLELFFFTWLALIGVA